MGPDTLFRSLQDTTHERCAGHAYASLDVGHSQEFYENDRDITR